MKRLLSRFRELLIAATLSVGAMSLAVASTSVWIADDHGNLGTTHTGTGEVHVVGNMGHVMTDIAISPTGQMYGVASDSLFRINPFTASTTFVGNLGISTNSLVFDTHGTLYTATDQLYKINLGTGLATAIGNAGTTYSSSGDLAFLHGDLYLSSSGLCCDHLFKLDTSSGAGTFIGDIGVSSVYGLASDDTTLYGLSGHGIYTIDTASGAGTLLTTFTGDVVGATWGAATAPVPEPETYALMAGGLAAIALFASRRRRLLQDGHAGVSGAL